LALVVKETKTLQHPTEPETTVVVRVPLSAGDLEHMKADGTQIGMTFAVLAATVQSWSYDSPVTEDAIRSLDLDTYLWLSKEVMQAAGIRDDDEKNASGANSSPTTGRGVARSRAS
jgi:hypothetical protein